MGHRRIRLRLIADALTFIRLCLALLIILTGIIRGYEGLSLALLLLLLSWMTDALDGQLARRDTESKGSRIGDNDLIVDVLLGFAMMVFFTLSGIIPFWIMVFCLIYLIMITFVLSGWTLYAIFIGVSYGTSLLVSLLHSPRFFYVFMLCIAIILLTTWSHCWENIQAFFTGFKVIKVREPLKKNSEVINNGTAEADSPLSPGR